MNDLTAQQQQQDQQVTCLHIGKAGHHLPWHTPYACPFTDLPSLLTPASTCCTCFAPVPVSARVTHSHHHFRANSLGNSKGYSYIEFWTDGGRGAPITCGSLPIKSSCEVINAGKVPKWYSSSPAPAPVSKWYQAPGYSPYKYSYNGQPYDKHSTYDPASGSYGQEPAYFQEVFPLSELKARCNRWGHLSKLESACWNKLFRPKPRSMLVGVILTMNDYYSCPKQASGLDPLICYVTNSIEETLNTAGVPVKVKAAPVECKVGVWWGGGGLRVAVVWSGLGIAVC